MTDALRILSSCNTWQGATDYGFLRAFRRAGHSVVNLSESEFFPGGWRHASLRLLRRMAKPLLLRDYQRALVGAAETLRPHLLFVYKGTFVAPETIDAIRRLGAVAINVYPDVSFTVHGALIPRSLPRYDWIFTTKSYGVADLARELGVSRASFLPHCYDPETHFPAALDAQEASRYGCDAVFIGSWSPEKEALLRAARERLPRLALTIWGNGWEHAPALADAIVGRPVLGREYAKAITGARINIALLTGAMGEASSGDLTTTRTFEIPAVGGFMLHARTAEAQSLFAEGRDCAMFGDGAELAEKIAHYLDHPQERLAIAQAGHARCLADGHSADDRAANVIAKARELMAARATVAAGATG
jgi:spore maturation protein CgeB